MTTFTGIQYYIPPRNKVTSFSQKENSTIWTSKLFKLPIIFTFIFLFWYLLFSYFYAKFSFRAPPLPSPLFFKKYFQFIFNEECLNPHPSTYRERERWSRYESWILMSCLCFGRLSTMGKPLTLNGNNLCFWLHHWGKMVITNLQGLLSNLIQVS